MVRARGFTLVEILVVVVIVGVLAGAVALAGGARGDAYQLREQAERFSAVVRLVADEAVLDTREYGIAISAQGYEVLRHDRYSGRWQRVAEWAPQRLPAAMRFALSVEGAPLPLPDAPTGAGPAPQIVLSSAGHGTPFNAQLRSVAGTVPGYRIDSDGMNAPQVSAMVAP